MAKKIFFTVLLVVALFSENIFALDFWSWHFQRPHFRRRETPITFSQIQENTITVWITNNNGSITEVKLIPSADGYLGPKGEYYAAMPTEEQLKPLYGVYSPPPVRNNIIVYLGKIDGVEKIVVLTKDGSQYIGPRGECYDSMPAEEQLKLIYGNP